LKSWCSTLLQCLHAPRSGLAVVVPVPAGGRSRLAPVAIAAVVAGPAASLRHIIIFLHEIMKIMLVSMIESS
jgi:hypothetical protein